MHVLWFSMVAHVYVLRLFTVAHVLVLRCLCQLISTCCSLFMVAYMGMLQLPIMYVRVVVVMVDQMHVFWLSTVAPSRVVVAYCSSCVCIVVIYGCHVRV